MKKKVNQRMQIISYIVLSLGAITMVLPFLWMLSTSLKSLGEVFVFPPTIFGEKIVWENFLKVADRFPFGLFFLNSLKISFIVVVGQLLPVLWPVLPLQDLSFPSGTHYLLYI